MVKLSAYYHENGILMIQRADYIEDGWFIEIDGSYFRLYEIPPGGGKAELIRIYKTFQEAYRTAISMT